MGNSTRSSPDPPHSSALSPNQSPGSDNIPGHVDPSVLRNRIFVDLEYGIFSSPNSDIRPSLPPPCFSTVDLSTAQYPMLADNRYPWMAMFPLSPLFKGYLENLNVNLERPSLIQSINSSWRMEQSTMKAWERLEENLRGVILRLARYRTFMLMDEQSPPEPRHYGYKGVHKSRRAAKFAIHKSHYAFRFLMAFASFHMARKFSKVEEKQYQRLWRVELMAYPKPMGEAEADLVEASELNSFSPEYPRAGVIFHPQCLFLEMVKHYIQANVPVWFYWGKDRFDASYDTRYRIEELYRPKIEDTSPIYHEAKRLHELKIRVQLDAERVEAEFERIRAENEEQRRRELEGPPPPPLPPVPMTGSGQRRGETCSEYLTRRAHRIAEELRRADERQKQVYLSRIEAQSNHPCPSKRSGPIVGLWQQDENDFENRELMSRAWTDQQWSNYEDSSRRFDPILNQWDMLDWGSISKNILHYSQIWPVLQDITPISPIEEPSQTTTEYFHDAMDSEFEPLLEDLHAGAPPDNTVGQIETAGEANVPRADTVDHASVVGKPELVVFRLPSEDEELQLDDPAIDAYIEGMQAQYGSLSSATEIPDWAHEPTITQELSMNTGHYAFDENVPALKFSDKRLFEDIMYSRFGFQHSETVQRQTETFDWNSVKMALGDKDAGAPAKYVDPLCAFITHLVNSMQNPGRYPPRSYADQDISINAHFSLREAGSNSFKIIPHKFSDEQTYYFLEPTNSSGHQPEWRVATTDPAAALQCLRENLRGQTKDAVRLFFSFGIPFNTFVSRSILTTRPDLQYEQDYLPEPLGPRHHDFKPGRYDYRLYEAQRDRLLCRPYARAACLHGGIVWRLWLHSQEYASDAELSLLRGPSDDALYRGRILEAQGEHLCDDALSEEETDLICGVYKVSTSELFIYSASINLSYCYILQNRVFRLQICRGGLNRVLFCALACG